MLTSDLGHSLTYASSKKAREPSTSNIEPTYSRRKMSNASSEGVLRVWQPSMTPTRPSPMAISDQTVS